MLSVVQENPVTTAVVGLLVGVVYVLATRYCGRYQARSPSGLVLERALKTWPLTEYTVDSMVRPPRWASHRLPTGGLVFVTAGPSFKSGHYCLVTNDAGTTIPMPSLTPRDVRVLDALAADTFRSVLAREDEKLLKGL